MTWITLGKRPVVSHPAILVMLRHALAAAPDDPRRRRALARELFSLGEYDEAARMFEQLLGQGGDPGDDWPSMVMATLDVRGSDAALALCDRWAGAGDGAWHHVRACAFRAGGLIDAADADFRRAVALGDPGRDSMRALLRMHAEHGDGARLLDACEALPRAYAATGGPRGYRALALSLLGRDAEANALVDLDAGVMRFRFSPPGGIGLAGFNDALADAILADQPAGSDRHDILLNHAIDLPDSAEHAALRAFIADSYAAYVARHGDRGAAFMPPVAEPTRIDHGAVTVRRQGRNGQHVHPDALLTGVYHVRLPALAGTDAGPDAGALVIGVCDEIAPGHQASWGSRVLPAEPGMLTLFPAHYFHDVRPTGVETKRVVVVADLMPA